MEITDVIVAAVYLLTAIVAAILIPLLKSKLGEEKMKQLTELTWIAVTAAEQLFDACDGKAKKEYVVRYLASKGLHFDSETVDAAVESAVQQLHSGVIL